MPFRKISIFVVSYMLFACNFGPIFAQTMPAPIVFPKVTVVITFDQAPTSLQISKAALKYNKKFAYSLTLDDGLLSAYSNVFPILKGGRAANDVYYNGFNYTDGCSHNIPFTAGVAWNSVNNEGFDIHSDNTGGYMTWTQLDELYNAGWDVLNHSYSHKTRGYSPLGLPNPSLSNSTYDQEINANVTKVLEMTHNKIEMTHFVVPSGDNGYYDRTFVNGVKAVYDQNWQILGQGAGLDISNPLNYTNFIMNRNTLSNDLNAANTVIDLISTTALGESNPYWTSSFTHDVEPKASTGGMDLDKLLSHMNYLYTNHGGKGKDQVWMAPLQEVFEYCEFRDYSKMTWRLDGNKAYVDFDISELPIDLRRAVLTLNINANKPFSKVEVLDMPNLTFNGTSSTNKLINLDFASYLKRLKQLGSSGGGTTEIAKDETLLTSLKAELFPNPTDDTVFLKSKAFGNKPVVITLIDARGVAIRSSQMTAQDEVITVSISDLAAGSYALRIKLDDRYEKTLQFTKRP